MRVALGRRITPYQGIDTYILGLKSAMDKINSVDIYIYESAKNNQAFMEKSYVKKISKLFLKLYRDQIDVPKFLKKNSIEIFHCTENYGIPFILPCKSIVTVHDVIPLAIPMMTKFQQYRWAKQVKYAIQHSEKVITISAFSKKDIMHYFSVKSEKIVVTYPGCNESFKMKESVGSIRKKYGIQRPFFLIGGGANPRKNIERIINIFRNKYQDKYQLIVTGGAWEHKKFLIDSKDKNIIFAGVVPEGELVSLTNAAKIFLYPSIYEGFGLPIIEAMACGTPVVTSNTSSIPEAAGNAAVLVDPLDNDSIVAGINRILESKMLESELIQRGLERSKLFTYEKTAQETLEVYRSIY